MVSPGYATTKDKVLRINLDDSMYGTFAEIGAGQETVNNFFYVGASAGTVAKSISAYDMTMSDAIYGKTKRYVSRERLVHMLDHEYELLTQRLEQKRGADTRFFSYANTVRARGYKDNGECHGWMGIRLQMSPGHASNDILLHVRLLDPTNRRQQEALGVLGVNLIYGALFFDGDLDRFVCSLMDNLTAQRVEVDMLKFVGPDFASVDNRICSLMLVEKGLTPTAMFSANGSVVQPAECFYRKPIVVLRGGFQPPSRVHMDMLKQSRMRMNAQLGNGSGEEVVEVMEITMNNLLREREGGVDYNDFVARADMLQALGKNVLVSKFAQFHRLSAFFSRYTDKPIGVLVGLPLFERLFEAHWYEELEGGILEGFGRLFKNQVRLHVYPTAREPGGDIRRLESASVPVAMQSLLDYMRTNEMVEALDSEVEELLHFKPRDIRKMILAGDDRWQELVAPNLPGNLYQKFQ
ncbi:TonB-dependent receptor [Sulfuriroseicoccus oceanibius]|uniref:TonB-dependent receptor n=1 Tax=Sulfuriroseicoccus oceanibius TaxID=2707525 RepID=A0A6B3L570_9BACT|nr:TonB-dependent receptor [Sulfuriroseicoccus oceanibius]QQL44492.1 TonB-dependent receptor [Sulfuriroseicoccus oceanibius]